MSVYWVFNEKQLQEALEEYFTRAVDNNVVDSCDTPLMMAAVYAFLESDEVASRSMRQGSTQTDTPSPSRAGPAGGDLSHEK